MKETLSGVGVAESKGGGGTPKKTQNKAPIWKGILPCDGQQLLIAVLLLVHADEARTCGCWWGLVDAEVTADGCQLLCGLCQTLCS